MGYRNIMEMIMTVLPNRLLAGLALLAGLVAAPGSARAAQDYDNCTGFIDSLPAIISTQGVWCLRKNLGTAITSGSAIRITTNNVIIDCNDLKIGGLAAGDDSKAYGINALNRQNITVRHCNVRGFLEGIRLDGGAGHLVEDNRLDNNLRNGILVGGDNNLVQRNRVYDTGGAPKETFGINANADVIDNTVAGVFSTDFAYGIFVRGAYKVRNNRIRGLQGDRPVYGISFHSPGSMVDGNHVAVPAGTSGTGIRGDNSGNGVACSNNVVAGFSIAMDSCVDAGGNTSL